MRIFYAILFIYVLASCSSPSENNFGKSEITRWQDNKRAAISITYDDATINQFRKAMPIMDSLEIKGTFFINTADIPGSQFPPKYFGKALKQVVAESSSPTTQENIFERASALRFLNMEDAVSLHNNAGSLYDQGKTEEAFKAVDEAFAKARKLKSIKEMRPVLLTGELITWPEIKQYADNGHEFGNHTISHPRLAVLDETNLLYELEKCKEEIRQQLGERHLFSAECPFGTENERVMQYAYKIHPALRNRMPEPFLEELNRWSEKFPYQSSKEYIQWQRGPLQKISLDQMKSYVDTLITHNNVWLVLTFHGVDGVGWEPRTSSELRSYFGYMKKHEAEIWIATFGDVTRYMRERMAAKISEDANANSITVSVSHSLDPKLYDVPLTIKTYVGGWKKITVSHNGKTSPFREETDGQGKYVLYQVTPGAGNVVIKEED
jgi:peptidoglycan/xylan/chitin deacetylase (PgdA/CDA1 family)